VLFASVSPSHPFRAPGTWDTAVALKRRISLMSALPLLSLDKLAAQREIKDIRNR
jgi:hypothetical protein